MLPYVDPADRARRRHAGAFKPHARWFLNSDFSLIPFYTVLALPFTFRAIDAGIRAIDVQTLVDASRSLGAGWGTTLPRALIPNLRTAIISSSFLTAAVVLGEFTIASVLLKQTLPHFMFEYQQQRAAGRHGARPARAPRHHRVCSALFTVVTRKRRARHGRPVDDAPSTTGHAHDERTRPSARRPQDVRRHRRARRARPRGRARAS